MCLHTMEQTGKAFSKIIENCLNSRSVILLVNLQFCSDDGSPTYHICPILLTFRSMCQRRDENIQFPPQLGMANHLQPQPHSANRSSEECSPLNHVVLSAASFHTADYS